MRYAIYVFIAVWALRLLFAVPGYPDPDSYFYAWHAKTGDVYGLSRLGEFWGYWHAPILAAFFGLILSLSYRKGLNDKAASVGAVVASFMFFWFYRTIPGVFDTDGVAVFFTTLGVLAANYNLIYSLPFILTLKYFWHGWQIAIFFIALQALLCRNIKQLGAFFCIFLLFAPTLIENPVKVYAWQKSKVMSEISELQPLSADDLLKQVYWSPFLLVAIASQLKKRNNTAEALLIGGLGLSFFMSRFMIFLVYPLGFYVSEYHREKGFKPLLMVLLYLPVVFFIGSTTVTAPSQTYLNVIEGLEPGRVVLWWDEGNVWRYYGHQPIATADFQETPELLKLSNVLTSYNITDICTMAPGYFVVSTIPHDILMSIAEKNSTFVYDNLQNGNVPPCLGLIHAEKGKRIYKFV